MSSSMTVPLATRRRVYLAAKTIFSGADAQVRRRKIIVKMVHSCSGKLDPLLREFGEPMLVDILRKLLEDRIFELTLRAKAEFPELFAASLRDAEREASEAEAASSTQGALDELQSGDEDEEAKELPEQMHPAEEYVPKRDIPPPDWPATTPSIPSLYPSYIPYQSQHLLLTTSQQILEECCFDFAAKWLPDIVRENGWDCPAAVELTEWNKIMGTKHYDRIPPLALDLSGSTLTQLLAKTHMLRHTAVHRLPTPARGISQLLDCAVQLAGALQDHKRAAQLEQLKSEVDSKIQAMELTKNFLENDTSSKLDDIRRQREELDRRERELIANMVRQDREDKALVGKLLMESVGRVLGEGMGLGLEEVQVGCEGDGDGEDDGEGEGEGEGGAESGSDESDGDHLNENMEFQDAFDGGLGASESKVNGGREDEVFDVFQSPRGAHIGGESLSQQKTNLSPIPLESL